MKELSLHILDIAHNSITAGATVVTVEIREDVEADWLTFQIGDNGKGMSKELLASVKDPFTTSRTTRKVGLGIPLLQHACTACGGDLQIESTVGKGTTVTARLGYSNIDRAPLGDMAETMHGLITSFPAVDFLYRHMVGEREFSADTRKIKTILGGVPLDTPEVLLWLLEYLREGEQSLYQEGSIE